MGPVVGGPVVGGPVVGGPIVGGPVVIEPKKSCVPQDRLEGKERQMTAGTTGCMAQSCMVGACINTV